MALSKGRRGEIPSDAVMLSEDEALKYQFNMINTWKNKSDTFGFRYGPAVLGALTCLVGIYINSHYRLKFKLLRYGQLSSYFPICVVPSLLSVLFHTQLVLPDVALQKSCVVCTELKSAAIQAMSGCLLPAILAPLSSIALATQYNTYNVPYVTKEPMKVFQLWQKQTKPIGNTLFAIFLCQALAAAAVTYYESKSVIKVYTELAKRERRLEDYSALL